MAQVDAFKCDRCTRLTEGAPTNVVHAGGEKHELCVACSSKLESFLSGADLDDDP